MVKQAGEQGMLDQERVIDMERALRKAVIQAEKGQPNGEVLAGHLTRAQALVAELVLGTLGVGCGGEPGTDALASRGAD